MASAASGAVAAPDDRPRRSRLAPEVRGQMILDEAVAFFAEHGFEAQTRDLATRLGVSQGLIFRYFNTKQALIESVYQQVFVQRWSKEWEAGLKDRTVPLQQRLERFYLSYFQAIDESHWIRVSLYASLAGSDIITRYIETHVNRLLKVIQRELRVHRGLSDRQTSDPLEFELVWHLHSTFIYYLVRKHIHRLPVMEDKGLLVAHIVANVLGNPATAPQADPAPEPAVPEAVQAEAVPAAATPRAKPATAAKAAPARTQAATSAAASAAPSVVEAAPAPAATARPAARRKAPAPAASVPSAPTPAARPTRAAGKRAPAKAAPVTPVAAPLAPAPKAAAAPPAAAKAKGKAASSPKTAPAKAAPAKSAQTKSAQIKSAPAKAASAKTAPAPTVAKAAPIRGVTRATRGRGPRR